MGKCLGVWPLDCALNQCLAWLPSKGAVLSCSFTRREWAFWLLCSSTSICYWQVSNFTIFGVHTVVSLGYVLACYMILDIFLSAASFLLCERSSHFFFLPILKNKLQFLMLLLKWSFSDMFTCPLCVANAWLAFFFSWMLISLGRGLKFGSCFLSELVWALLVNSFYIMCFATVVPMQAVKLRDWAAHEEACSQRVGPGNPPSAPGWGVQTEGVRTEITSPKVLSLDTPPQFEKGPPATQVDEWRVDFLSLPESALSLNSVTLSSHIIFLLSVILTFLSCFCFTDTQTWLCFCFWLCTWGVSLCHSVCEAIGGLSQVSALPSMCLRESLGSAVCARLPGLCASACPPVSTYAVSALALNTDSGDSNSDPHALRASPSPTELSPQPLALFLISPIWHYIMFLPDVNTSSFHFQIFCLISLLMPSILPAVLLMSRFFFLVPSPQTCALQSLFPWETSCWVFKPPSCLLTAFYVPLNPYIVFLSFKFL